jgi:uncharacterized membrane protein
MTVNVFFSLLVGVILVVPGVLGIFGALPKNDWVGIRMNAVMRSQETWDAAHKAGGPWLVAAGVVAFITSFVVLFAHADPAGVTTIEAVGMVSSFVIAGIGAWVAQSAARRVG